MGHRNATVGRHRHRRGHPRHHFIGHAARREKLQLLPATAEEEGVAPLEPDHPASLQGLLQENPVDLLLGLQVAACPLSHVDFLRLGRNPGQDLAGRYQGIEDHHLRLLQDSLSLEGQQPPVRRAGSHQPNLTRHAHPSMFGPGSSPAPQPPGPVPERKPAKSLRRPPGRTCR